MIAEIINIGDELLIGQVVNTNASWMAEQLFLNGIEVKNIVAISDTDEAIKNSIDLAISRADLVIMTGGLGPTKDDITKQSLCEYFGVELIFNDEAYKQVEELFANRGFKVSERNRHQAMLPANCTPIKNVQGTAPGMWFEHNDTIIVSVPGVPFEMKSLLTDQIIPKVKLRMNPRTILKKTVLTQGIGESHLADRIIDWESGLPENFKLAYLPQPGIVRLRLTAFSNGTDIQKEMDAQLNELHQLIPELIWGYDDDTFESVVADLLKETKKSVSSAESCTGGTIAQLLTSISGSSDYFNGSVVAYSNEVKERQLGVPWELLAKHGAVSKEVVEAMASGAKSIFGTDYALATSGIAGPTGGTEDKPVGTVWIALAKPDQTIESIRFQFGEHRGRNIRRSAIAALNMLRMALLEGEGLQKQ